MAIDGVYAKIVADKKLDVIGRPEIFITKLARGNPLGFRIRVARIPEIKLPDYKKITKDNNTVEAITPVTDEEIDKTILEVRQMRAHQDLHKNDDVNAPQEHDHDEAMKEENLPPLDDAFVATLGAFKDVEDFKNKIRENITLEKERIAKDKARIAVIEELIKNRDELISKIKGIFAKKYVIGEY